MISAMDECVLWSKSLTNSGYGQLTFNRQHKGAHRLVWELNFGPIPKGLYVLHKCDVRSCVNPDHLFLGTPSENQKDCVKKGRKNAIKGEQCTWAKLRESDVSFIRSSSETQRSLAKVFGISQTTVWMARNYKHWKHV